MKRIILLMVTLIVLSGCVDGDRYNFSGSSENWDVFYVVDIQNRDEQDETGTIKYIGEEPAPEEFNYRIEYTSGGSEGTGVKVIDGVANIGYGVCRGCAIIQEDEKIEVEITWNGQTETLILTNDTI